MIIDIQDPILNLVLNFCLWFLLVLALISLIPWRLKHGKNRWTLMLPVMSILIYMGYELLMPDNWNIRMDLILIWPVLTLIILLGLVRFILIRFYNSRSG